MSHPSLFASLTARPAPTLPHRLQPVWAGPRPFPNLPAPVAQAAQALAAARGFTAQAGQTLLLPLLQPQGLTQWLLLGLGTPEALRGEQGQVTWCQSLAKGLEELRRAKVEGFALELPPDLPWPPRESARLAGEALLLAAYSFRPYHTRDLAPAPLKIEVVHPESAAVKAGLKEAQAVAEGVALTRDLINQPAAVAHPGYLLEQAQAVAQRVEASYREIKGESLIRQGYEAVYAVGQASEYPPALASLEYGKRFKPTLVLVGKGVTFDTGGLDLKTSTGMALMKKDMGGAAIVLGAFQAIATLKLPVHVVAVLGVAENAVGPRAYRPGDVVRTKAGLTVEITNTDAEGRVVLADALALAQTFKPDYVVDFATLTGACRVALGRDLMGLFCDHDALRGALQGAARETGEAVWPLPLWAPYRKKLESPVADLINAPNDGMAGAITAALFLKEFAGPVAWAHLDCYAWSEGDSPLYPKGGSGVGVRLLVNLVSRLS